MNLTAPAESQIRLTVHDFALQASGLCVDDSLVLYDAPDVDKQHYIATFCGKHISSQVQSTSGNMFLHFKTNDDGISSSGFRISFEYVGK